MSHEATSAAIRPITPTSSERPMSVTSPRFRSVGPLFSDIALYFLYANTFIEPAAMKANARTASTAHKAILILSFHPSTADCRAVPVSKKSCDSFHSRRPDNCGDCEGEAQPEFVAKHSHDPISGLRPDPPSIALGPYRTRR